MDLSFHFIVSAIIAAALYPIFGWLSILVIAGGFLIDADHYVWTVVSKKTLSLQYAYSYYKRERHGDDYIFNICHTAEFFTLVMILALLYPPAALFATGYMIHLVLDRIDSGRCCKKHNSKFNYFWFNDQKGRRTFSILYWLLVELKIVKLWQPKTESEQINERITQKNNKTIKNKPMYERIITS
jgi:hypothetical protein